MPTRALFLERQGYRRRRLMDVVRILPVVAVGLWMIPLLWQGLGDDGADPVPMSQALKYIFAVWCLLILACGAIWVMVRRHRSDDPAAGAAGAGPGPD